MTAKNERGPSALQHVQTLCQGYGLSVPTDVQRVQVLLKHVLTVYHSYRDGAESWFEHNKCEANKAKLQASFRASECKLSGAQPRV